MGNSLCFIFVSVNWYINIDDYWTYWWNNSGLRAMTLPMWSIHTISCALILRVFTLCMIVTSPLCVVMGAVPLRDSHPEYVVCCSLHVLAVCICFFWGSNDFCLVKVCVLCLILLTDALVSVFKSVFQMFCLGDFSTCTVDCVRVYENICFLRTVLLTSFMFHCFQNIV